MKLTLLIILAGTAVAAWGQQSSWSGNSNSRGPMLTPAVLGSTNVALPDPALLNWKTDVTHTPSPGGVVTIGNGTTGICAPAGCTFNTTQLATAVNSLACGETLEMQNTVYIAPSGNLNFVQVCDSAHWITIERDVTDATFPAEGNRVTPCYSGMASSVLVGLPAYPCTSPARHMPYIQKSGSGSTILISGSYYRFVGIEWGRVNTYDLDFGIITLNNNGVCTAPDAACMNAQATNIVFDRNIVHGDAQRQTTRAFAFGGARWVAVLDSYIYDITLSFGGGGGDAQAYGWGNGKYLTNVGFGKFVNNFVSSSTMSSLFCGSFVEPLSPATGFDGIPHDVWFSQQWLYKNPLWDTQIGQTLNETETIEGAGYGPVNDQAMTIAPTAMQLAAGQPYQLQVLIENDSRGGINRATPITSTLTCGSSDCGSVASVFTNVGTGIYTSQNQRVITYTAPASVPTGGTVTVTISYVTSDDRSTTLGNNRTLSAQAVFTIVNSNPAHQMAVGPAAADLKIQPSYADSFGNKRQFCLLFNAIPNFTSTSTTWAVDGVTAGNSTVGTVDSSGLYCSPSTTGAHIVRATASDGTQATSTLAVSSSAPIVAFDLKTNTVKNGWELKCGNRVLLENSFLENAWGSQGNGGGQPGAAILTQSLNQASQTLDGSGNIVNYGPEYINDTTIRYLKALHFGQGFTMHGENTTLGLHRMSITNVLCDDCNNKRWAHGFVAFLMAVQVGGGGSTVYSWESTANPMLDNVSVRHVTLVGSTTEPFGINSDVAQPKLINYTSQDNFFAAPGSNTFVNPNGGSTNCDVAQGSGANNSEAKALVPCFDGYIFNHLALLDSTAASTVFLSSPIWQPASTAVGFVNYNGGNGGDYRLCKGPNNPSASCSAASIFAAGQADQASDGTDLGADIVGINAVESTVRGGVRTP
ncbi:MAG TPA: hypothetical protein VGL82_00740 [Bryobacteraceae bacterium]